MKNLRIDSGLRVCEVARGLGVHRNTVQRWEDGGGKRGIPKVVVGEFDRLIRDLPRMNYLRASRRRVRRIRGAQ